MSTGARRILANTAYRLIADVGSKLASIAFYVVMARELGAKSFGVFTRDFVRFENHGSSKAIWPAEFERWILNCSSIRSLGSKPLLWQCMQRVLSDDGVKASLVSVPVVSSRL